ncbi:transposase family protein [Streptomyces sp. NPDC001076]
MTCYKAARTEPLTAVRKQVNTLSASVRAVCEDAFARLKNWRILTKFGLNVRHAPTLLRALLVLTTTEVARWQPIPGADIPPVTSPSTRSATHTRLNDGSSKLEQ